MSEPFTHVWFWRKLHPERKGQVCKIIDKDARRHKITVEFEDGERLADVPGYAVRFAQPDDGEIGKASLVVYEHDDGTFRWRLVRGSDRILAISPGRYSTRETAHTVAKAALAAMQDARIKDA